MISIFYGEEQYAMKREMEKQASKIVDVTDSFSYIKLEYPKTLSYGILEEAQTISMFSDHKLIVVEQATFLSSDKSKDEGLDEMINFVLQQDDSVSFFFLVDSIDKRKKVVKDLSKIATVKEFNKMDDNNKQRYIFESLRSRNMTMSSNVQNMLVHRLPNDMGIIQKELDKLELYGDEISESVVDALVVRTEEDRIFELMDAIIKKDRKSMIAIYTDLKALRKEEIQLIALLASQFRVLYQVKVCDMSGMFESAIVSKIKAHPYQVKKSIGSSRKIAITVLRKQLLTLANLDQNIKAGKVDKQIGFEQYLLECMR